MIQPVTATYSQTGTVQRTQARWRANNAAAAGTSYTRASEPAAARPLRAYQRATSASGTFSAAMTVCVASSARYQTRPSGGPTQTLV